MSNRRKSSWSALTAELRRRRVYPVVAAYAVVSWIALQVAEVTFEPLGLPDVAMVGLIVLVVAGFPLAVVVAWTYDITPLGVRRTPDVDDGSLAAEGRSSVAVLPFVDMSAEGDQAYFCEGVAEEILNTLAGIDGLRVAARSMSFRHSGDGRDAQEIGRSLGVDAVLEGSVRKSEDRLRVTAQLVDVSGGYDHWSRSFDEPVQDVFAIQDEIAMSIAEALLETLPKSTKQALRARPHADVDAYDYYLRGRQFFRRFHKVDIEHARAMFRRAIERDPRFALAWAGFADCHSFLLMYADPDPDYAATARDASDRALSLAPELAEAHASRGLASLVSRDFDAAEREFRNALELNPNLYEAYYYFARTCFHQGDVDKAAELFAKAAECDPSEYQSRCLRVQILRGTGRIDEARNEARQAVAILEKNLEWNPDDARAYHLGAGSLVVLGDLERARRWLRRALELDPDDSILLYNVACNFATMGDADESLDYLERAARVGMISADWMRNDEDLANLREEPRYLALLESLEAREASRDSA
ncbi:MAG: tetratricopeptide repeat protein [Woeseiaceae bacterium]|nr:tetratricopeptide repeat protein [Woeseiaceae bacterium]